MENEIKTYSTKEASKILGIKERAVQTRCKKDNIRKKDNKYLITDLIIADWKQKEEANAKANATPNATLNIADFQNFKLENNIKVERAKKNITQRELATLVKVSRQTINAMELDKIVPSTVLALKLAHVFEIEVSQLFTLEGSEPHIE